MPNNRCSAVITETAGSYISRPRKQGAAFQIVYVWKAFLFGRFETGALQTGMDEYGGIVTGTRACCQGGY